jgi:hypothetical protein
MVIDIFGVPIDLDHILLYYNAIIFFLAGFLMIWAPKWIREIPVPIAGYSILDAGLIIREFSWSATFLFLASGADIIVRYFGVMAAEWTLNGLRFLVAFSATMVLIGIVRSYFVYRAWRKKNADIEIDLIAVRRNPGPSDGGEGRETGWTSGSQGSVPPVYRDGSGDSPESWVVLESPDRPIERGNRDVERNRTIPEILGR